jgi:hypothetical protein
MEQPLAFTIQTFQHEVFLISESTQTLNTGLRCSLHISHGNWRHPYSSYHRKHQSDIFELVGFDF